jgi:hypothetical protein
LLFSKVEVGIHIFYFMWNEPTELAKMPRLYETENVPVKDKIVHIHFFLASSDWYIVEFDGEDIFFGFACLNGSTDLAEWGYISFKELKELKVKQPIGIDGQRMLIPL